MSSYINFIAEQMMMKIYKKKKIYQYHPYVDNESYILKNI